MAQRKPMLATGEGRGQTGKTRTMAALYEIERAKHGRAILLDLDTHTPSISRIFPSPQDVDLDVGEELANAEILRRIEAGGAYRPESAEPEDQKRLLEWGCNEMAEKGRSLFCDTGGGEDRWLFQAQRELDLSLFCKDVGARRWRLMFLGPDEQDLAYLDTVLSNAPFHPEETVLCMNAGKVPADRSDAGAFDAILRHETFTGLRGKGCKAVVIPRLGCMQALAQARMTYADAKAGRAGTYARSMVRVWEGRLIEAFREAGVDVA